MTWDQALKIFRLQTKRLYHSEAKNVFVPAKNLYEFEGYVLNAECEGREELEDAIRSFCVKWRWPKLSNTNKFFLKQRLFFAADTLELFARSGLCTLPENFTKEDLLKKFLIDLWMFDGLMSFRRRLYSHWEQVIATHCTPEEFYKMTGVFDAVKLTSLIVREIKEWDGKTKTLISPEDGVGVPPGLHLFPQGCKRFEIMFKIGDGNQFKGEFVGYSAPSLEEVQKAFLNKTLRFTRI